MKVRIIAHQARVGTMQTVFEKLLNELTGEDHQVQIVQYVDNELEVHVIDKDGNDLLAKDDE